MEVRATQTARRLRIERRWKKAAYTIGRLYVDGELWCNTLEDTDRGLDQGMTVVAIKARKVKGQTAIPRGTYEVVLTVSAKFAKKPWAAKYGGLVPYVQRVKGFDGIRIHPGTTAEDTSGCILPGLNTKVGQLTESVYSYDRLMGDVFIPAYEAGESVILEIF